MTNSSKVTGVARRTARFIEGYWLALFILALGVWTLTPWLAPLFMHWGWTKAGNAIYAVYSVFCHQLPQRSWFFFGEKLSYSMTEIVNVWPGQATLLGLRGFLGTPELGWKLAWSDRMVSFYGGLFWFGLLYLVLRGRFQGHQWRMSWRWMVLLLLPIALDGTTHAISDLAGIGAGFRETNAWLAALSSHAFPASFYVGDAWGSFNSIMRLVTGLLGSFAIMFWALPRLDGASVPKRQAASNSPGVENVAGQGNVGPAR